MYTIIVNNAMEQVFIHPLAEDRLADIVRIVTAPSNGIDPEDHLLREKFISQKTFRKVVKLRAAQNGSVAHDLATDEKG